jgi:23S rRNA pseudouridine2605 synthase
LIRLQKILSQAGVASRRAAETLITQGRVEVNGHVVSTLGSKADPTADVIKVDGRRLKTGTGRRYLLMYKPRGVVSTRIDPQKRTTVVDLVARAGIRGYFYPVGRLDYESEGLILLTNDGEFAQRVAHPSYEVDRTYEALVEGVPDDRDLDRLRHGVVIDGGRTGPAEVRLLRTSDTKRGPQATIVVRLHEGRNRQVRRMCDAIAHPIVRLKRIRIGSLGVGDLHAGDIRDLSPAEVRKLMASSTASSPNR